MESCVICFEEKDLGYLTDFFYSDCECKKYYHKKCLIEWMEFDKRCPICKKEIIRNLYEMMKKSRKTSPLIFFTTIGILGIISFIIGEIR